MLHVFHSTDEQTQQPHVTLLVRTVKEFVNFGYEIILADTVRDGAIDLVIHGLHAPAMIMPGSGPAYGVRFYPNLTGRHAVSVTKSNRATDRFLVEISADTIELIESPKNPFVHFTTEVFELK